MRNSLFEIKGAKSFLALQPSASATMDTSFFMLISMNMDCMFPCRSTKKKKKKNRVVGTMSYLFLNFIYKTNDLLTSTNYTMQDTAKCRC
jgi:hypothetical protein